MTEAVKLFEKLSKEIPGVKAGKMFNALCLKVASGKVGAMLWKDFLVVKLAGEDMDEVLTLDGAKPFEPMKGRQMKGWLQIPYSQKSKWKKYAAISIEAVKKIKKK